MIDERTNEASAALASFLHAFARLIAQEVQKLPQMQAGKAGEPLGAFQNRKLLTVKETADILRVKPNRIYEISHWKGSDGLRCVRIGRQIRFRMEDVQDYLKRQARGGP